MKMALLVFVGAALFLALDHMLHVH
jgi:hypothetical protein